MTSSFIYPTIVSLPLGYDATIIAAVDQIADRLVASDTSVECAVCVVREGSQVYEETRLLVFENGKLVSGVPAPFFLPDAADQGVQFPAYAELSINSLRGDAVFSHKSVISLYTIYTKAGKKTFYSDNAYKYGAPPIITQMAAFGQYVDGHPLIHLDRQRDLGETIVLINPYKKKVLANVKTQDGRLLPRLRIPPMSARNVRLGSLMRDDEDSWIGQIQLSATNRLIPFIIKHSLQDPLLISDHEHFDPYRSDPTHFPATQLFRIGAGRLATRVGALVRPRRQI